MNKISSVKSTNTKPEMIVRRWLYSLNYRYYIHFQKLPGKPDIVFTKKKIAIFINGCFWHQHEGCKKAVRPKSNIYFWNNKLDNNINRDLRNKNKLEELGYKVIIIWECEIINNLEKVKKLLLYELS